MTRLLETRPLLQGIVGGQHWILNYITTSAQVEPEQCQLEEDQVAASQMLVQVCLTRKTPRTWQAPRCHTGRSAMTGPNKDN